MVDSRNYFSSSHKLNSKFSLNVKYLHNMGILYSIINNIPMGIILLDTNFNIVIWNSEQEKISGIPEKNILGKNFFKTFSHIFSDNIKYRIKNILKTKETIILDKFSIDEIFFNKCFNIKINPIKYENDSLNGIIFNIQDCSIVGHSPHNLKTTKENHLKKDSEAYYYKIIDLIPTAIFIHINGDILFANTFMCNLLGLNSPKQIIRKNCMNFISKEYHKIVKERINLVQEQGKIAPLIEQKFIRTDGHKIDVKVTSSLFPYKGLMPSIVIVQELDQSKHTELLMEKLKENKKLLDEMHKLDKLKAEFFSNISHELRTPLNIILSALQLLNTFDDVNLNSEKSSKYLNIIKQNCFRLLKLTNNLIDINKMDSGYFEIHLSNHNIVNVIEDITLSVAQYIKNKSINLIFDTDIEEKFMACDPDKIERIMLNLISNSIKFTNPGGSIFVNVYDKKDHIIISVKDTGIGMHKADLNLIFDRFHQVDKSLSRNIDGSGIGLSLVKSLVEMHGGQISVKSTYGKGTEFIIKLPSIIVKNDNTSMPANAFKQNYVQKINIEFSDVYSS